ncbi:hypothetical protein PHYPO_G00062750 [Pangasianodon hypophthalmus]|uniref:Uncharacterized protein n=1 Tax=Pangasianodon hypophthalmus TaxID=310915 RepID=A0A5N5M3Y5_PANHP|nr:hypothetical protein PHYPO_G00062750 [Pangasianodon hypophthalmus]
MHRIFYNTSLTQQVSLFPLTPSPLWCVTASFRNRCYLCTVSSCVLDRTNPVFYPEYGKNFAQTPPSKRQM